MRRIQSKRIVVMLMAALMLALTIQPVAMAGIWDWSLPKIYEVKFHAGDHGDLGNPFLGYQLIKKGDAAQNPGIRNVDVGWKFVGWDKDFSNVTGHMDIYAQYKRIATYTVTFDNGGHGEFIFGSRASQVVSEGGNAKDPGIIAHMDWTFTGWDKTFNHVTSNLHITAQYRFTPRPRLVTFCPREHGTFEGGSYKDIIQAVPYGGTALAPKIIPKSGYLFMGWSAPLNNITKDLFVHAIYAQAMNVTFDAGAHGSLANASLANQVVPKGGAAKDPGIKEVAGWRFTGWDKSFSNVQGHMKVTAQYEEIYYTVSFNAGSNGTLKDPNLATQSIRHGQAAADPGIKPNAGQTFEGWDKKFAQVTSDLKVNATYKIISYTVTFKDHDGSVLKTQTVDHGSGATAPSNPDNKANHHFVRWDVDYSNITGDLTVTAIYEIDTYTVTFEDHDGTVLKTETVAHGSGATAPSDPDNKTGHHFLKWDVDYSNITGDLTVTAIYEINTYTVTFKDHDGTVLKTEAVTHGSGATAPSNPDNKTGYHFLKWDVDYSNITGDLTVTAIYEINTYTVTFKDHDGTVLKTETVDHGSGATAPSDPDNKTNHHFVSWDVDYSNITGDLTVTAIYEIDTYTVTFEDHDGTVLKTETVAHGSGATAPSDPDNKTGHHFLKWDVDYSNITGGLTVTAIYEINTYTVTFEDHDGTVLKTEAVTHGSGAAAPSNPDNKTGYHFLKWDVDYSNVVGDLTVTAVYEINVYTVSFTDHDGALLKRERVEHGKAATAPSEPDNKTGYHFVSWSVGFDNVTHDLSIKAQYGLNLYVVTFVSGDNGSITNEALEVQSRVPYGKAAKDPGITANPGWSFKGWDAAFDDVKSNLTIKAVYDPIVYTVKFDAGEYGEITSGLAVQKDIPYGGSATEPQIEVADGWELAGWSIDFDNVTSSFTTVAQYRKQSYTVTFNAGANGALRNGEMGTQDVPYGGAAQDPGITTKDGWRFVGWDTAFDNVTKVLSVTALYEELVDIAEAQTPAGHLDQPYQWWWWLVPSPFLLWLLLYLVRRSKKKENA